MYARSPAPAGDEAAQTFIKLADVHVKLESKSEAASSWVEASKAYQKSGNPGARQLSQSNACARASPHSSMSLSCLRQPCSAAAA